jgi:hypothetical protein
MARSRGSFPDFNQPEICSGGGPARRGMDARRAAHREKRRRNHLSDARGVRPYRSSSAKINHLRQRHRLAQHALLRTMRDMTTWFCDAYASWQKGGIENANGRLRRWLPRHLDIDRTSDQDIQEIVLTTNLTPRKCLGFKTPFQALVAELGKDIQIRFS